MTSFGNAPRQFTGHHDGSAAAAAGAAVRAYPGVIFKDGPCGRRAALAYGPDVWEVIKFLREVDERGPAAVDAAAEVFAVDTSWISTAISYYDDYAGEIDAEIAEADEASACAEAAWRAQQHLIAPDTLCASECWWMRSMAWRRSPSFLPGG